MLYTFMSHHKKTKQKKNCLQAKSAAFPKNNSQRSSCCRNCNTRTDLLDRRHVI